MEVKEIIVTSQEGDTRVCSIGVFFLQYFGNFNIQLWYSPNKLDTIFLHFGWY